MYLLEITFANGNKDTFKSKFSSTAHAIEMLAPHILFGERMDELNKHGRKKDSFEYYRATAIESRIDGRKREYKDIPWFTFRFCFENMT